jgi:hypothetical protein
MAATLVRATGPSCARRPWLPSGRVPPARAGPVRRAHPPGRAGVVRRGRLHRSGLPPPDARAPPARAGSPRRWLPPWRAPLGRASARHGCLSWPPRPASFAPRWRGIGAFPGSPPARGEAHLRQTHAPRVDRRDSRRAGAASAYFPAASAGPALFAPSWRAASAHFPAASASFPGVPGWTSLFAPSWRASDTRSPGWPGAIRSALTRGIGAFPGGIGWPGAIRFELACVRHSLPRGGPALFAPGWRGIGAFPGRACPTRARCIGPRWTRRPCAPPGRAGAV